MCIRDSIYFRLKDAGATINAVMWKGSALAHGWLPRDGDQAVSYTHLRAHETVLDLVCRLLLEKQNHLGPAEHPKAIYAPTSNALHPDNIPTPTASTHTRHQPRH